MMFKDRLIPYIRGMVSIQKLRNSRDVVEVVLIAERNQSEVQRDHKVQSQLGT